MAAQDGTVSLSAVEMSSAESAEELDPPFVNIAAIMCDHSYLPMRFGGLVDTTLVSYFRICCSAGLWSIFQDLLFVTCAEATW